MKGSKMNLSKLLGEAELATTTQAVVELGELAMIFGRINRTCVVHPTGEPESDADHTVMLIWVACSLAELINLRTGFERYPVGKVAQFAAVHDAVEVYAGDTPTHKITSEELAAKEFNEAQAANRLYNQFIKRLPWFARLVRTYEQQVDPVARFVRSVDKIMPKIVHVLNAATDLMRAGLSYEDFLALYGRQRQQIENWCPEPMLLQLYDELCEEVERQYRSFAGSAPQPEHYLNISENVRWLEHSPACEDTEGCPVSLAFKNFLKQVSQPLRNGRYFVRAGLDGLLCFADKEN